ncbi:MAG: hypothetical protein C4317_00905 [Acidimicrobiia bacterium]
MGLHQFLECAVPNDAVTASSLVTWKALRRVDPKARMWASAYDWEAFRGLIGHYSHYAKVATSSDICLYHASCYSPISEFLADRKETLAVFYHNITPAHFFERLDPLLAHRLKVARRQVRELAQRCSVALAGSHYSAAELQEWGFPEPTVVGEYVEQSAYEVEPDSWTLDRLKQEKGDGPAVLFVGRLTPNKAQHKLIEAVGRVKKRYPSARLWLAGGSHTPSYAAILQELADYWGLGRVFAGKISQAQLISYYSAADIFCCLSEHEGFCIPILEAMRFGCPVIAYAATAVPETAGGAAVLLESNDPREVADAIVGLWEDPSRCGELIDAGRKRVEALPTEKEFGEAILRALGAL